MAVPIAIKIRAKKLGVLLRGGRKIAGKTIKECAEAIGATSYRISAFERGDIPPSLPELEGLAFYLNVPLSEFWEEDTVIDKERYNRSNLEKMILLRQRIIGAKLRHARQEANISMKSLAAEIGVSTRILRSYERGERPIPLPDLEVMLAKIEISIDEYRDQTGVVAQWDFEQQVIQQFLELPPELQSFITKPINAPYLNLAQRLSKMSAEQLRAVAEGLLEITY